MARFHVFNRKGEHKEVRLTNLVSVLEDLISMLEGESTGFEGWLLEKEARELLKEIREAEQWTRKDL